ncbi:hypothetical protein Tco_0222659 [Tanacetum coccineum]
MVATRLHQPWRAILSVLNRCLTGKDSIWDTIRLLILQILWGIVHSDNLDFASLIWDEFKWKTVKRSSRPSNMSKLLYIHFTKLIIYYIISHNKSIPHRSDYKLHSSQDDQPITKLLSTTNGDYKFGMEVPDAMISDAIKKKASKCLQQTQERCCAKKTRSLTIAEETVVGELAHSISIQEPCSQQRQRSQLTIDSQTDEAVANIYNEWGQKLKGPAVDDPAVQSLLDLRKGSKANSLESLRQKKQAVAGEGSSVAHNKYYDSSDTDSDAILYSSSLDKLQKSANETDDPEEYDMDLSDDNPDRDDDVARYGVFMHNKSTPTPNSTYLNLTVRSSSLHFIQTLLDETPTNELMDFMSHLVYTDAQTTSVVHNPEGNPELTSYISGASEVLFGTHVDVLATKTLMQEIFPDENAHQLSSPPAIKTTYPKTNPQPNSL